jgi:hypothetical protein
MMHPTDPDGVADPRRAGLTSMVVGAGAVGVSLGIVALAAAMGWSSVMLSGGALLVGWIIFGFGLGEFLFVGRFRIVIMLLALIIGIAGMGVSFWVLEQLGFPLSRA